MIWKHKDSEVCPIVTSLSLARIALSFSNCSLRASFCFGVSWGSFSFPCFLRFSSNSLRSCNSSSCSLYEYTLLSRFIFFTFSSLSLSFLHNATHSCYIQNKQYKYGKNHKQQPDIWVNMVYHHRNTGVLISP